MARLPLLGGSYSARSIIANCQRCINYFPESNPKDSPVPLTHYQRPGLVPLVSPPAPAICRGLYRASNGNGYTVIGNTLYAVSSDWNLTVLGNISTGLTTPVSMIDNGITLVLVDGSAQGWQVNLASNVFSVITDGTGTFLGADRVDYIDTFVIWNMPGTPEFGSTLSNSITFDPLYFAGKTNYPDKLVTLLVNRHVILLLGELKSEIWYDAGNAQFPFAELPGAYIEHGIVAKYSVAATDISTFWLGQNLAGQGMVFRQKGYTTTRVSNHAVEYAIRKMVQAGTITDAIGYIYQQDGHVFYVLQFPSGDQTWVFDDSLGADPLVAWHQRAWTDGDGVLHRERGNCCAFLYGKNIVGDWENGTIYELDPSAYTDIVNDLESPITCIRTFPHIGAGIGPQGLPVMADGKRMEFKSFAADIESGNANSKIGLGPAQISLRWSDDRGKTFGNPVLLSNGGLGEYLTQPIGQNLGVARDRIFELSHSIPGPATLNGAWVDATVLNS